MCVCVCKCVMVTRLGEEKNSFIPGKLRLEIDIMLGVRGNAYIIITIIIIIKKKKILQPINLSVTISWTPSECW